MTTAAAERPAQRKIHGQPSYVIATKEVELAVIRLGGHLAPVHHEFVRSGRL